MKLSIIIPVYNAEKYLRKCLETVVACPSSEMECILVNDGSKDASLAICEEYTQKDSRIFVVNKKNEGVSVARNTGMLHALGEYIFFLDADDYIDIKKWHVILKATEEVYDFIAFSYYTLWENGVVKEEFFPIKEDETRDIHIARNLLLASASLNACWGKLMRRDKIQDNGITFKEGVKTGEDALFIMNYFQKSNTCSIRNESVLYYRQHSGSVMYKANLNSKLEDFQAIYDYRVKLSQQWRDTGLKKEMYRQFFSIITHWFLVFSRGNSVRKCRADFSEAGNKYMVDQILMDTPYDQLAPVYKKLEYHLIKRRLYRCLAVYFKLKNQLGKLK